MEKQFCLNKIYKCELADVDQFQQVLEAKIQPLESHLWRLFAELMDADCLNSTNLEQFLPMKNKVQI